MRTIRIVCALFAMVVAGGAFAQRITLESLQSQITALQSRVEALELSVFQHETDIATLVSRVGQNVTTVFGTFGLPLTATNPSFFVVPGLTMTVTVPANSVLYVSSDGGIISQSTTPGTYSIADIALFVNGVVVPNGGFRRTVGFSTAFDQSTSIQNWSMASGLSLSAGTHTIEIRARHSEGAALTVSGDSNSVLQGQLTVAVFKR